MDDRHISEIDVTNIDGLDTPVLQAMAESGPNTEDFMNHEESNANDIQESGDEEEMSRSRTPENDSFPQDEPSSALASRIINANDNPSPPPSPSEINDSTEETPQSSLNMKLFDSNNQPEGDAGNQGESSMETEEELMQLLPQTLSSPTPNHPAPLDAITHMVLNTFEIPSQTLAAMTEHDAASHSLHPLHFKGKERESSADTTDEDAVMLALTRTDTPSSDTSTTPSETLRDDTTPTESPLRRSARPRRSATPFTFQAFEVERNASPDAQKRKRKAQELDSFPAQASTSNLKATPSRLRRESTSPLRDGYLASDLKAKEERRQMRLKQRMGEQEFRRELGSLSPASASLLSDLTADFSTPNAKQHPTSSTIFPSDNDADIDMQTPTRTGPIRFRSPVRNGVTTPLPTPSLQLSTLPEPNRTPARRVPFNEASLQVQMLTQKPLQSGPFRAPVFTPGLTTDSPARRVPIGPSSQPLLHSPSRSASRVASGNGIPPSRPLTIADGKRPDTSPSRKMVPVTRSKPLSAKSPKLPFPLVPSTSSGSSSTVRSESPAKASTTVLRPSPEKSSLKQASRIPRIRSTPYARPGTTAKPALSNAQAVTKHPNPAVGVDRTAVALLKRQRALNVSSPTRDRPIVLITSPRSSLASPFKSSTITVHANTQSVNGELHAIDNVDEGAASDILPPSLTPLSAEIQEPKVATAARALRAKASPTSATTLVDSSSIKARTTRSRRVVTAPESPAPKPPRKAPKERIAASSTGPFSGLSAVALKTLTSTNTVKNQQYLTAKLETEIVRKDGNRPESPPIRVRTTSQRLQEEKALSRKVRAERRARRSLDGTSDGEWASDREDQSSPLPPPEKHQRGPGEDEDYQSPEKLARPFKRLKLAPGDASDQDDDNEAERFQRRVKWDKGLSTSVFIDDVQPGTRTRLKDVALKKGCLASSARTLQLDTLGNLSNTEIPLADLVEENIVVKKFVYDNDVLPAVTVIEPKTTRSKSKRKS